MAQKMVQTGVTGSELRLIWVTAQKNDKHTEQVGMVGKGGG